MAEYGVSDKELSIIKQQAARRAQMRSEFLKQRTNPFKHASEAGYVFDPAFQRFLSMNVYQLDHFKPNSRTSIFGVLTILPMFAYGYWMWKDRKDREDKIRCGELVYRDRLFKLQ